MNNLVKILLAIAGAVMLVLYASYLGYKLGEKIQLAKKK